MMKEIGGYFELELREGEHYHSQALRLNTARNCFEYILRARKYTKVYIPYYTCEVMLEPLKKYGLEFEFYSIDALLEPLEKIVLKVGEAFLYTNYFGLKQTCVEYLASVYGSRLLVDNAQAFYAPPVKGIDTFYSARKFFGVPDGAYLYTDKLLDIELERDVSYQRSIHLLRRIDESASRGYANFRRNDDSLIGQPIKKMSRFTDALLRSIDYDVVRKKRVENYKYLKNRLDRINRVRFLENEEAVPMVYPFYSEEKNLRKRLIDNKIYVATYWPNVLEWAGKNNIESDYVNTLMALPVDQRCDHRMMENIVKVINTRRES